MQYPKITFFGLETNKNLLFSSYTWHTHYRFINRSVERAIGKVGIRAMYSIQKAAEILGRSKTTIKRWLNMFDMKLITVKTDRKRVYISDANMQTLVDHLYNTITEESNKNRKTNKSKREIIILGDTKYYSFAKAASFLGVSVDSVMSWSKKDGIERKLITTDKKRGYISHDDVLRIAELHRCKLSSKIYEDTDIQKEVNTRQPDMDQLCSMRDAALCLDVSIGTVRKWVIQDNIDKRTKFSGRHLICITYRDILRLAELHGREVVPNPSSLTVAEEIKEIKKQLQEHASDIEDIKHDLRLLVKRSIYIG